jgi:2-polyprenyl-3-methyl-5-hydroxy-6-metoxy-1,4-benzoquinol methylase
VGQQIRRRGTAPGPPLSNRTSAFLRRVERNVAPPASVLDLGCGTGEFAVSAAVKGYRVPGADISPEMLEFASANHEDAMGVNGFN